MEPIWRGRAALYGSEETDAAACVLEAGARIRRRAWFIKRGLIHTHIYMYMEEKTCIDHPVGDLAHAELCAIAQVTFFILAGIGMVRVSV